MRRVLGWSCLLALSGVWQNTAHAQGSPSAGSQAGSETLPGALGPDEFGEESEELRALRLSELEIFGRDAPLIELTPELPRRLRLSVPDAITSIAEPMTESSGASGRARDLSWLEGLNLPDIPVRWDSRVIRYLEFFREDPRGQQLIRSWMRRLDRFGPLIRSTLRAEGLPEDLIYIAMIESGFDPRARSAAGAVGLWQFVSRTGAEYGLTQDHWVDMRMDPEASTQAGARYLSALQRRFGTWELTFAAYNMGYGALLRSIRKYDTNDYWELSHLEAALPFETTLYVSKVIACAIVGRNPERFGLSDVVREEPLTMDTIEVAGGTGLRAIARAAGTELDELRRLNPALRRERTPPGRERFVVRIPAGTREAFVRAFARRRGAEPGLRTHTVRFGEDLRMVARRYRATESELRALNELDDHDSVRAGFALMVPAVPVLEDDRGEPPTIAVPPGTFEYADRRQIFYAVRRHDDLRDVARFFEVTVDELLQWNAIDPHASLHEGMFLQLFVPSDFDLDRALVMTPDEVRTLSIGSEEFHDWHVREDGRIRIRYRVEAGDTLSEIAARFGLSTASMARINQIARDSTLRVGQELVVYTSAERVPAELRAQLTSEPTSSEDAAPSADADPQIDLARDEARDEPPTENPG